MANSKNVLNSIRTILGMESEIELLAEAVLEDGTKIATESEQWGEGVMAYVVSEDGEKMPLPTGSYSTQDGVQMEVVDGEVTSISKEEAVEEAKSEEKEEKEEEMSSEIDLSAYATKEQLVEALGQLHAELSEMINNVVSENNSLKENLEKVSKMSAEKPVKHSQTNLNQEVSYNTGDKVLDMMLKLKNEN
ncbi:MAG: hypothetical protein Unbinned6486contig1001_12 [Prokaryotic dsDNA virus sp.]|nr:MAG: hypothetical protein Unbinned6486contig1001_12 [Prokaryotic dsDNA virus sp.]|tara:strand:+ start:27303 stop:27875 length:573 start_codon:yes stop_codon:yes gene_type:complete